MHFCYILTAFLVSTISFAFPPMERWRNSILSGLSEPGRVCTQFERMVLMEFGRNYREKNIMETSNMENNGETVF